VLSIDTKIDNLDDLELLQGRILSEFCKFGRQINNRGKYI